MNEAQWDKLLRVKTGGRDESNADVYHYPYEPTPYCVLERLVKSEYITKEHIVVDYGCGKGRVGFFLNHEIGCRTIGIEYDERICQRALENKESYGTYRKVEFVHTGAEQYEVTEADCFYFFNPFSVEILQSVIGKILASYYETPRPMQLFFYYPNDEYIAYLMTQDELMFSDEIDCRDLFEGDNEREKILIFEVMG